MLRSVRCGLAAALLTLKCDPPALAAQVSSSFQVQITITNSCSIDSTQAVNFGTVGSLALGAAALATVQVQCTLLVPYSVSLGPGLGSGATTSVRKMTSAANNTITYSLFQDVLHLVNWGNQAGVDTPAGVGTGLSLPHVIYGYVPPQTTPLAGSYTDTVAITVNY